MDQASEKKLAGVKGDLAKVARRAAEISKQPFQIIQGNRTQAEQDRLFAQGRTRPGKIVTWTRNSRHIGGNAVDYAALGRDGKISWDEKKYPEVARAFKQAAAEQGIGIEWGGDWRTKDWGHIQLTAKPQMQKLAAAAPPVSEMKAAPPGQSPYGSPRWAVDYLEDMGWPKRTAVALVANMMWESGGNVRNEINWQASGDAGHSHGAAQWNDRHGRWQGLLDYAKDKGTFWSDPATQLEYLDQELRTTERFTGNKLRNPGSLKDAMQTALGFWRPGVPHADRRNAIAARLEEEMGNVGDAGTGSA